MIPSLTFPAFLLLTPLVLFLLFYVLYSVFTLYHLLRFGLSGVPLYLLLVIYIMGTVTLLGGSLLLLSTYDWTASLTTDMLTKTFFNPRLFTL